MFGGFGGGGMRGKLWRTKGQFRGGEIRRGISEDNGEVVRRLSRGTLECDSRLSMGRLETLGV
jgi:hypothetical protein